MVTFQVDKIADGCEVSMLDWYSPLVSVCVTSDTKEYRFRIDLGKRICLDRFDGEDVIVPVVMDAITKAVRAKRIELLKAGEP